MSYLTRLKEAIEITIEDGLPKEQYLEKFRIAVESNISNRLATLHKILVKIDEEFKQLESHYGVVAARDRFSEAFEQNVLDIIDLWIAQDEALRKRYKMICEKLGKKVSVEDLKDVFNLIQKKFYTDIAAHVAEANNYGISWGERLDHTGLLVNKKIKNSIAWFSQLTIDEVARDYQRELG